MPRSKQTRRRFPLKPLKKPPLNQPRLASDNATASIEHVQGSLPKHRFDPNAPKNNSLKRASESSGQEAKRAKISEDLIAPSNKNISLNTRRLYVILEHAALETIKISKKVYELANFEKHKSRLDKLHKDPAAYRPDIVHQSLLMLLDSPLNRAGLLQVFIHTRDNVLIRVHPQTRLPRTLERFSGLMVQLLQKQKIRATESGLVLLKLIRNPVTEHLPAGCAVFSTSVRSDYAHPRDLVPLPLNPSDSSSSQNLISSFSTLFAKLRRVHAQTQAAEAAAAQSSASSNFLKPTQLSLPSSALPLIPNPLVPPPDPPTNYPLQQVAIIVGAMAHGSIQVDYADASVSVSKYPLSAALTCSKICTAFEDLWHIT